MFGLFSTLKIDLVRGLYFAFLIALGSTVNFTSLCIILDFAEFFYDVPKELNGPLGFALSFAATFLFPMALLSIPGLIEGVLDMRAGSRRPSARELTQIDPVKAYLQAQAEANGVKLPNAKWLVKDSAQINAAAYGRNRIYFTTGLLKHARKSADGFEQFAGVAAHELGHLRNGDARENLYYDLLLFPVRIFTPIFEFLSFIPIVNLITRPIHILVMLLYNGLFSFSETLSTSKEYAADRYAFSLLGEAGLASLFNTFVTNEEAITGVYANLTSSHPPSELRRDELVQLTDNGGAPAHIDPVPQEFLTSFYASKRHPFKVQPPRIDPVEESPITPERKEDQAPQSSGPVWLNVPYVQKDQAKALGAKFDWTSKRWYAPDNAAVAALEQWLPQPSTN
ncbi:M48 family metalloprotease [Pseudovibrio sp. Tun.PSC04-5.I4]|uniref:M48 family metalloprotease n=1 Tax=Pseudovibrio sp. Tun.PSC04-5.I4 TaxID=1798213 RepID=UPI0008817D29|nr:M48 family metalloprotease [Pseudovibrio sp. Tun.PSC04-5.I4]SDR48983.1 Zn-dependent protease with chaperone function [Pseudovibrio sp. Tun.PSC04-5.I4]